MFNKLFDKLENALAPIAEKMTNNKVLLAIRDGFLISTPLLITASIFLLIANFPIPGYSEFVAGFFGEGWESNITVVSNATFSMIALLNVVGIGYSYARQLDSNPIAGGVLSLVNYLMISPQSHPEFTNADGNAFRGFSFGSLGAEGLFLGMIVALLSVRIFAFVDHKGWTIKMPDGVPPAVMQSFAALIPSMFAMITFFLIRLGFSMTSFGFAQDFIYTTLQTPLMVIGDSYFFLPLRAFFANLFWFFGINGPAVVGSITAPIMSPMSLGNLEAFQAGESLPYIFTSSFSNFFTNFGGGGSTLSLAILMITTAKSDRMKKLGALSIIPAFFGINEMIIFGLPIVLNPVIIIPFILVPLLNISLSTLVTVIGLIPRTTGLSLPWTTPIFFSGWLATGSFSAGFWQIALLILGTLIYYPFFKILDKQYVADEQKPKEDVRDELDDISLDDISFDDL